MKRSLTLLVCALGTSLAVTRVPGTSVRYSAQQDPITDANTSVIMIGEVNDTSGLTQFTVRCADRDRPELWAILHSKNDLLSAQATDRKPTLTVRLGDEPPVVLGEGDLVRVMDSRNGVLTGKIGLQGPVVRRIVSGLDAGNRLVVRVNRTSGGQALTYIFPAGGFGAAWRGVGGCQSARTSAAGSGGGQATTLAGSRTAGAPKLTQWYFSTCREVGTGVTRAGLVAGRASLCNLVVEFVPNGARPVAAEFRYELEYREGSVTGKLTLPGVDHWPARPGGPVTRLQQEGDHLIFTLPLNVRARADRVYTSLNVTGKITFSGGGTKSVYEPLPVRPGN